MQFRERRHVIQVIRTVYDPTLKRGRSEVVGQIDKGDPVITDKLHQACTPEEVKEIAAWLLARGEALKSASARSSVVQLTQDMAEAVAYFQGPHDPQEARAYADSLWRAWEELKKAMRKAGYAKPDLRRPTASASACL